MISVLEQITLKTGWELIFRTSTDRMSDQQMWKFCKDLVKYPPILLNIIPLDLSFLSLVHTFTLPRTCSQKEMRHI